uniref:Integral membrane protein n=1 Tax=Streptomyces sp. NBC_01401 TaxID=2903854 RepID=A0AAU3GKL4_9ACTN
MAATDDTVADDDALFVLTAVLLTPAQFPSVLGDDYVAACAELGLEPFAEGYGLVLGQDSGGARWTVVVEDVSLVAVAIAAWDCGMEYDLSPDDRSVVCALPGWPLALAVAAPGVPDPHDPPPGPDDEGPAPLTPPDTEVWGAPQRRLGADEIALQWAAWRDQIDDETAFGRSGEPRPEDEAPTDSSSADAAPAEEEAEEKEEGKDSADSAGSGQHPGVRKALEAARAYVGSPPPPGRIRSAFAPGGARTLRADGPGWSLVARTDDIAFILLDEEPGEIMPVGRGPELPGLLKSLDELAVRPS